MKESNQFIGISSFVKFWSETNSAFHRTISWRMIFYGWWQLMCHRTHSRIKFLSETVIADVLPVLSDSPLTLIIKDSDRGILDVTWSLTPRPFRLSKPLSGECSIVKLSYWQIQDLPKLSNLLDSPLTLFIRNSDRGTHDVTWSLTPRPFRLLKPLSGEYSIVNLSYWQI